MNYHITDSSEFFGAIQFNDTIIDTSNNAKYVFRHMDDPSPVPGMDELGWHFHTCYELLYFLRGDADYLIEQNRYTLRPHSLLIIPPGVYHTMLVISSKRLDRIVIHFSDECLSPKMRDCLASLSNVYCIPGTRLSDEILLVDTYQQDLSNGISRSILVNQLHIILEFLCRLDGMHQAADQMDYGAEQIISYIHSNLSSIHTLDDICQNVHMSRSTVQNLISDYLQTPVMSYVRVQKCILAKNLLKNGGSATEVALQCGFSDYSTFYRAYRKVFGIAPTSSMPDVRTISTAGSPSGRS